MSRAPHRRRIRFIDVPLQQWLVLGLVAAEAAFVAADVWILHRDLAAVLEDQLYRVHLAEGEAVQAFRRELAEHLGIFALANLVLLSLVEAGWAIRVMRVVRGFDGLIRRSGRLDYGADAPGRVPHAVVRRALDWRARERERLGAIRRQRLALEAALARGDAAAAQRALGDIAARLPPRPAAPLTTTEVP